MRGRRNRLSAEQQQEASKTKGDILLCTAEKIEVKHCLGHISSPFQEETLSVMMGTGPRGGRR